MFMPSRPCFVVLNSHTVYSFPLTYVRTAIRLATHFSGAREGTCVSIRWMADCWSATMHGSVYRWALAWVAVYIVHTLPTCGLPCEWMYVCACAYICCTLYMLIRIYIRTCCVWSFVIPFHFIAHIWMLYRAVKNYNGTNPPAKKGKYTLALWLMKTLCLEHMPTICPWLLFVRICWKTSSEVRMYVGIGMCMCECACVLVSRYSTCIFNCLCISKVSSSHLEAGIHWRGIHRPLMGRR